MTARYVSLVGVAIVLGLPLLVFLLIVFIVLAALALHGLSVGIHDSAYWLDWFGAHVRW